MPLTQSRFELELPLPIALRSSIELETCAGLASATMLVCVNNERVSQFAGVPLGELQKDRQLLPCVKLRGTPVVCDPWKQRGRSISPWTPFW